jgi:hypothetical protein
MLCVAIAAFAGVSLDEVAKRGLDRDREKQVHRFYRSPLQPYPFGSPQLSAGPGPAPAASPQPQPFYSQTQGLPLPLAGGFGSGAGGGAGAGAVTSPARLQLARDSQPLLLSPALVPTEYDKRQSAYAKAEARARHHRSPPLRAHAHTHSHSSHRPGPSAAAAYSHTQPLPNMALSGHATAANSSDPLIAPVPNGSSYGAARSRSRSQSASRDPGRAREHMG